MLFTTKEEYQHYFQKKLMNERENYPQLTKYVSAQFLRLEELITCISQETFWQVFPEILGIDARLSLLVEMIKFDDFSVQEILRIIEQDYPTYFKELSGYDLNAKPKHSMVFNVV